MAAAVEHSDALKLLEYLEKSILKKASFQMTYGDAAQVLGRNPATDSRHVGQVASRIDAACFYAKTPFLAMHRIRETETGGINRHTFNDDLWGPHFATFVALAERHRWTADDFRKIRGSINSLGDDSARLLWERIDGYGEKAINKALGSA